MLSRFFNSSRIGTLCCFLAVGSFVFPVANQDAVAQKRRRGKKRKAKKKKRPNAPQRSIRTEADLAPKAVFEFDSDLSETQSLKTEQVDGPSLNLNSFERGKGLEGVMEGKLDEEIGYSRQLLELETGCGEGAQVRFRLADLYWEKSKRAFFRGNDFERSEDDRRRSTDQMKKLQTATVANYGKIIDDCPDYPEYAKTLFGLGKTLAELDRAKEAAPYFKRIIKEFPKSEWVPNAWFMVGQFYFYSEDDAKRALRAYKEASKYTKSQVYGFSIYQQGWCYINLGEYDLALERFRSVVVVSDDPSQELDVKGRRTLRKEALKDYVRAYSHVGSPSDAFRDFIKTGGKAFVQNMMENLGQWYTNRDDHRAGNIVHGDLIRNFPRSRRLPLYQGKIVHATSRIGNKKDTVKQAKLLTKYFNTMRVLVEKELGGADDEQARLIKKDVAEAEGTAENILRSLAIEYDEEARKLRGQSQKKGFIYSRDLYDHYLTVFPEPKADAEVNYVFFMRFKYAEVLYELEDFLKAARNYDIVLKINPDPKAKKEKKVVVAAAENAVRAYDEVVKDLDRANPPDVSGIEKKPIPKIKQDLIAACRRYISYAGDIGERIVEIRYKMARVYYTYNHFDQAAPAFNDIVTNHPKNAVACYSANLVLDIYAGAKNYRALKKASRSYLNNRQLACGDEDRAKFSKIEQNSTYNLIKTEYEEKKRYRTAANAYMKFYDAFPNSEFADDSVYNAAVNFGLANQLDRANKVREFLVKQFPNSSLVPETIFDIAKSYERVVDFSKAAEYLTLFAKKYPADKRSKDAIYNSGLYRERLRDFKGSKSDRERFVAQYPGDKDVPDVAFSICETLEKEAEFLEAEAKRTNRRNQMDKAILQKWNGAHDCYFDYIKKKEYVSKRPDNLCYAQYRRGEIMRDKTKYEKGFLEQRKYVLGNWPKWRKKHGAKKLPRCAESVAIMLFRAQRGSFASYRKMKISELKPTDRGKKVFDASVKAKVKTRDSLIKNYQQVVQTGVAEWALASLYQIGELYRDSIEKLLKAPIPKKIDGYTLNKEEKNLLREELKKMAAPVEADAVEAYRICVDKANELGVYNKWSEKALERLEELRPDLYHPVEERFEVLDFPEPLRVAKNEVVIKDGEGLKNADAVLMAAPKKKTVPKPKPAARTEAVGGER